MIEKVYIDTNKVRSTADNISYYNNTIQNNYSTVLDAIKKITYNWEGTAADRAQDKYRVIHRCYYEGSAGTRFDVIESYVSFLKDIVAQGYEKTEATNQKISKAYGNINEE